MWSECSANSMVDRRQLQVKVCKRGARTCSMRGGTYGRCFTWVFYQRPDCYNNIGIETKTMDLYLWDVLL